MELREILIAMRELLTPDGAWCQSACHRDAQGNTTAPGHPDPAVSHCLYGAALTVCGSHAATETVSRFLQDQVPVGFRDFGYIWWNDEPDRTQAEVLAFLDERIAELEPRVEIPAEWILPVRELEDT